MSKTKKGKTSVPEFHAIFPDVTVFCSILDAIAITAETNTAAAINIHCSEEGLSMQLINSGGTTAAKCVIRQTAFDAIECPKPLTLGVPIGLCRSLLRTVKAKNPVDILKKGDTLEFSVQDGKTAKEFAINLMEIEEGEQYEIPDNTDMPNIAMIPSKEFKGVVDTCSKCGENCSVRFSAKDVPAVVFSVPKVAGNQSSCTVEIRHERVEGEDESSSEEEGGESEVGESGGESGGESDEDEGDDEEEPAPAPTPAKKGRGSAAAATPAHYNYVRATEPTKGLFLIRNIHYTLKGGSLSDYVDIGLEEGRPLRIHYCPDGYEGDDGGPDKISLTYFIAPRIED